MIKVFESNQKGKIELTKDELEKLLNEAYDDGKMSIVYVQYPTITTPNWIISEPYKITCTSTTGGIK